MSNLLTSMRSLTPGRPLPPGLLALLVLNRAKRYSARSARVMSHSLSQRRRIWVTGRGESTKKALLATGIHDGRKQGSGQQMHSYRPQKNWPTALSDEQQPQQL